MIDYDAALVDAELLDEIELLVKLMVAAAGVSTRVPPDVVDETLNVRRAEL